jgi:hypothetical protein
MLEAKKIEEYIAEYQPKWAIVMPDNCPPAEIDVPHCHPFFRLTHAVTCADAEDLKSYAELNPQKDWGYKLPLAVGLSLFNDENTAKRELKLPYIKRKHLCGIAQFTLRPQDGVVKQTTKSIFHYTWWRTLSFNIQNAIMIDL